MEMTIDINSKKLEQQLANLADKCGLTLAPILKEEARYLVESAIKTTPPPNRAAGERTLSHDLQQVAISLNYRNYEQKATGKGFYKSLARYIRNKDTEKVRALIRNPKFHLFQGMDVIGSRNELWKRHYERRRFGRVKQRPDAVAFSADFKGYYNSVKKRVGFMLSGWSEAASVVGAKQKKFAARPYAGSNFTVRYLFARDPYFVAVNRNIRVPDFQKILNRAIEYRLRIATTKVLRANQKLAINLGFAKLEKGSY